MKRSDWPAPIAMAEPQPGDFCCVPISGAVGLGITIGQWLDGDRFQFYDHAEIYVGQPDEAGPHGYTISAYPGVRTGRFALPCPPAQLPGSLWSSGLIPLTPAQRDGIVAWATAHQNVHYSFLDYGALVLHALRIPAPGLREYIRSTGHMICSWFTDADYLANGVHLFDDGRWEGYVKPGDLARLLQSKLASEFAGLPALGRTPLLGSLRCRPADSPAGDPRHFPDPEVPAGSRCRTSPVRPGDAVMSEPRHRAPRKQRPAYLTPSTWRWPTLALMPRRGRRAYLATLGVTGAAAISTAVILPGGQPAAQTVLRFPKVPDEAHVQHVTPPPAQPLPLAAVVPDDYTIRTGDTLAGIAARLCGSAADYRALAANNHIRYANQVAAGDVIKVACHAAAAVLARVQLAPPLQPAAPVSSSGPVLVSHASVQQQSQPPSSGGGLSGTLGCSGLEQLWDAAGGNPQDAFMAAEIAMAESGGNQFAVSPTDDYGYWQINASNGSLATTNALGNARSAIILSGNGTNWSPWTTYTSGMYAGKC